MTAERLLERRKWFGVFPEGTLEFMIITRVLALLMLIALAVVGGAQRPFVLAGLAGILWVDYALLLSWAIQVAMDLRCASGEQGLDDTPRRRTAVTIQAMLPSLAAVIALMPWSSLVRVVTGSSSPVLAGVISGAAVIAFLALLWPAYRALRGIDLGSPIWTILFLVPLLHFFASHRLACGLDARIRDQMRSRGERVETVHGANVAVIVADVMWILTILPWAIVIGIVCVNGWPAHRAFKLGPVCGTMLAALFAIANLAALEAVQRQIVALISKDRASA
ncbi:MAG TPA: hypothetical protein PLT93_02150 [Phycisphaerae bacterium]|nr:hypothetical protein [Phycisphaerae bacterium]HPZ96915.1 hypothetical protein [Phycisphaerae bacterium]